MSILNYFTKNTEGKAKECVILPAKEDFGVSGKEYDSIKETLEAHPETKKRGVTYKEEEKMKVVKYACSHGVTNAIRFFKKEFPNLTESTVRNQEKANRVCNHIREKRETPTSNRIRHKTSSFHNKYENSRRDDQQTCYLWNFNGSYQG